MNIFSLIKEEIKKTVELVYGDAVLHLAGLTVELPRDSSHGDMSSNVAMILAKPLQRAPREIAAALSQALQNLPDVQAIEIAGPGFLNFRFTPAFWQAQIVTILSEGVGYGNGTLGRGIRTNVEYVSANPTGPMHIGHARGAVVGDALALLLIKAGYDVTKEYYINDAGAQIEKLAKSAYLRYREACGEAIGAIPEGYYPGEYLKGVGEGLKYQYGEKLLGVSEAEWLPIVREFAVDSMMTIIKADLLEMGITHDVYSSEAAIKRAGKIEQAFDTLTAKGLVYQGTLPPPKSGKAPEDWEPAELTLFKSSEFGDDGDRPLKKRNGEWTYIMPDVAYHFDKIERGFTRMILEVGQDHIGYEKRLKAAVAAMSDRNVDFQIVFHANVQFLENGEPIKMSKRSGTFTTVSDVMDAVGKDVLRFVMLTRKPDQSLDFDLAKVKEQSRDNPVFYVQYAHARCKSLLRMARTQCPDAGDASEQPDDAVLAALQHPAELALLRRLSYWPQLVESAALGGEPHRICYYIQEVAAEFHALWNIGNDDPQLRFIVADRPVVTAARLSLIRAVATVIASGLQVLGVEPVEEMR